MYKIIMASQFNIVIIVSSGETGEILKALGRARKSLAGEGICSACGHWCTLGSDPHAEEGAPTDT